MSFGEWATGLFLAAFFSAFCAYRFNRRLAHLACLWEEERHIIRTVERLCDSLMEDVDEYWATPVYEKNSTERQASARKISISSRIISVVIYQSFPNHSNIKKKFREMVNQVTGGSFGTMASRSPDEGRAGLAISSIMELRMSVSQESRIKSKLFQRGRS